VPRPFPWRGTKRIFATHHLIIERGTPAVKNNFDFRLSAFGFLDAMSENPPSVAAGDPISGQKI